MTGFWVKERKKEKSEWWVTDWMCECLIDFKIEWVNEGQQNKKGESKERVRCQNEKKKKKDSYYWIKLNWKEKRNDVEKTSDYWAVRNE